MLQAVKYNFEDYCAYWHNRQGSQRHTVTQAAERWTEETQAATLK
jgi:hypothetical protein